MDSITILFIIVAFFQPFPVAVFANSTNALKRRPAIALANSYRPSHRVRVIQSVPSSVVRDWTVRLTHEDRDNAESMLYLIVESITAENVPWSKRGVSSESISQVTFFTLSKSSSFLYLFSLLPLLCFFWISISSYPAMWVANRCVFVAPAFLLILLFLFNLLSWLCGNDWWFTFRNDRDSWWRLKAPLCRASNVEALTVMDGAYGGDQEGFS